MRVVFVEVDTEHKWAVASLGPAYIGAVLRNHGHEVALIRATYGMTSKKLIDRLRLIKPDILGFSVTTRQWLQVRSLVAAIRKEMDIPVVAGGMHPTFSPESVLNSSGFDFVCIGEGEVAMLELVENLKQGLDPSSIPNIWARGMKRPALRPPFLPLDDLPFMARDLLDEYLGCYHMNTQRGCPFPCSYCGARMFNELYKEAGEYGRRRSIANVMEELSQLQQCGLSYVIFLDDTFTIQHSWVKKFCEQYREQLSIPFSIHARVETVSRSLLSKLAEAGCKQITYGIESGSYRIRKSIMRRPVSEKRIKDVIRWTRDEGILTTVNFMLGLPEETCADIEQTLQLAEELEVDDFYHFIFYPYPGTELFIHCQNKGYLPQDYIEIQVDQHQSILNLPTLTKEQIKIYDQRFTELRERKNAERFH